MREHQVETIEEAVILVETHNSPEQWVISPEDYFRMASRNDSLRYLSYHPIETLVGIPFRIGKLHAEGT